MTGLYAHNHGVHTSERGQAELMDQQLTMQRYLRRDGYKTAIYGKYLNAWPRDVDPPWFDDWAILSDSTARAYFNGRWNVNGKVGILKPYSTRVIERRALRFLEAVEEEDDAEPWFLYLAPMSPHLPATPHPLHRGIDIAPFEKTPAMLEEDRTDKPSEVQEQAVVRRLKETGEAGDTLAIYMSDNGFLWGEHGVTQKIRPYEASAEIPFFVRWPGRVERGAEVRRPVANIDVAPTILAAAGIEPDHEYDGRSFLDSSHDRILLEQWKRPDRSVPNWAATRGEDYLYVEYYAEDRLIPAYREYYDLVEDPWELHNLLGDLDPMNDPENAVDLSLQLHRDVVCAGTSGPSAGP